VIARFHLQALSEAETAQYVEHRLAVAGLSGPAPFERSLMPRIRQLTRGVPRRINLLCDRALLGAYVSQLVGMFLPGPLSVMERIDLGFRRPCIAPCELHLRAKVRQVSEAVASVVMDVVVSDAEQQVLASGKTWHKILREAE